MTDAYVLREMVAREQADFAAMLRDLTPEQWATPSLCRGWSVHDAVLHITWHTHTTDVRRVAQLVRARSETRLHEPERALPTSELIDRLASPAILAGPSNILTQLAELVIHQQDVRRPLGLGRSIPAERLSIVLDFAQTRAGGSATLASSRRRSKGLRLLAADTGWAAGAGPEVRGPGEALFMALNGRAHAVADLEGDGLPVLASRIKA
jgi:uncharacterized protein (TIGR03083 family)